jgi:hypothetical protein
MVESNRLLEAIDELHDDREQSGATWSFERPRSSACSTASTVD